MVKAVSRIFSIGFNDEICAISGEKEAKSWSAKVDNWA